MINAFLKNKIITKQFVNYFSTHAGPTPSKLQKVEQTLVYLFIKNAEGQIQKCPAFVGQSLLDTITRMKVRGFNQDICFGHDTTYRPHVRPHDPFTQGPKCGNCRVVLSDNWYERVVQQTDGMSNRQRDLVQDVHIDRKINTRLACCIPIESWMQGMTLSVDPIPELGDQNVVM